MENNIKRRGFGSMAKDRLAEVSKKGGLLVPKEKRPFYKDRLLASSSGKKGGSTPRRKRKEPGDVAAQFAMKPQIDHSDVLWRDVLNNVEEESVEK